MCITIRDNAMLRLYCKLVNQNKNQQSYCVNEIKHMLTYCLNDLIWHGINYVHNDHENLNYIQYHRR